MSSAQAARPRRRCFAISSRTLGTSFTGTRIVVSVTRLSHISELLASPVGSQSMMLGESESSRARWLVIFTVAARLLAIVRSFAAAAAAHGIGTRHAHVHRPGELHRAAPARRGRGSTARAPGTPPATPGRRRHARWAGAEVARRRADGRLPVCGRRGALRRDDAADG